MTTGLVMARCNTVRTGQALLSAARGQSWVVGCCCNKSPCNHHCTARKLCCFCAPSKLAVPVNPTACLDIMEISSPISKHTCFQRCLAFVGMPFTSASAAPWPLRTPAWECNAIPPICSEAMPVKIHIYHHTCSACL